MKGYISQGVEYILLIAKRLKMHYFVLAEIALTIFRTWCFGFFSNYFNSQQKTLILNILSCAS
jgi:hypothetical protein